MNGKQVRWNFGLAVLIFAMGIMRLQNVGRSFLLVALMIGQLIVGHEIAAADVPIGRFVDPERVEGLDGGLFEDQSPYLSADGLSIYFRRGDHIWMASRASDSVAFGEPVKLGSPINLDGSKSGGPHLSADGQQLYFHSDLPGEVGIWVSDRDGDGWGEPAFLGPNVNSGAGDFSPAFSPDQLTVYWSSTRNDQGDMFEASSLTCSPKINHDSRVLKGIG